MSPRDILSEFGNDAGAADAPRATNGGKMEVKSIPYSPPKGPTGMMRQGPGLGGTVHPCGSQRDD